jgi:uncharacterized protein (DUF885 family)
MSTRRTALASLSVLAVLLAAGSPRSVAQNSISPTPATAPQAPRKSDADRALGRFLDDQLETTKRNSPVTASVRGDRRFDRKLSDESEAAYLARARAANDALVELAEIDIEQLSDENRVNYALLERDLRDRAAGARFKPWQFSVTNLSGPQQDIVQIPERMSFDTRDQKLDFVARIRETPRVIDQTIANMRAGIKEGRVQPRTAVSAAAGQAFDSATDAHMNDPTTHPLYAPFEDLDPTDPIAIEARAAIKDSVIPSMRQFGEFLRDEYIPACRDSVGASEYPDGAAFYDYMLGLMTTTDLTAGEIHEIGLSEVARIRAEMMGTIRRSDFMETREGKGASGDDERLFRAFLEYLRTNERFYAESPEELLAAYRDVAKRADAWMPRLFKTLPRLPYGVREMPAFMAPSAPTAYYMSGSLQNGVAGNFVANTYKIDTRPLFECVALTLHEAVPGHHHQIALMEELESVHEWRTWQGYTGFIEGWGLYSERLGLEMERTPETPKGMYQDPYDDFGRLSYEMWRAMRLVVDTGMHSKGWTREQAIDYMLSNSGLSRKNVEAEVDRYIGWPGQATAYKIGELKIRELRAMAERELGESFDVREFHDVVLMSGAVPLDVLERNVIDWVDRQAGGRQ